MQALVHEQYGAPEALKLRQIPVPTCGENDVLILVHNAAINPMDWKMVGGLVLPPVVTNPHEPSAETPLQVGFDVSGVITQVGSNVSSFEVGDEVYAMASYKDRGTMAEYFATNVDLVAKKPSNVSHVEAAGLPLVSLTMYQAIVKSLKLQKGNKLLLLGGSGGTGSLGIQIAHHLGIHVATTCSSRNIEYVKSLGADVVIDYSKEKFENVLKDAEYDAVLDCVGDATSWESAQHILKQNGLFASIAAGKPENADLSSREFMFVLVSPNGKDLTQITDLVEKGQLKPTIGQVFPLDQFKQGFEKSVSSRSRGKLVLSIKKQ